MTLPKQFSKPVKGKHIRLRFDPKHAKDTNPLVYLWQVFYYYLFQSKFWNNFQWIFLKLFNFDWDIIPLCCHRSTIQIYTFHYPQTFFYNIVAEVFVKEIVCFRGIPQ